MTYLNRLLKEDRENNVYYQLGPDGILTRRLSVVKIGTSFGDYYVYVKDLRSALRRPDHWQVMTLVPSTQRTGRLMSVQASRAGTGRGTYVSAVHGQEGTQRPISHIIIYHLDNQLPQHQEQGTQTQQSLQRQQR